MLRPLHLLAWAAAATVGAGLITIGSADFGTPTASTPRLMRWPALGANLKPGSVAAGRPEIEFLRERFSVSEAMTYYQFVLDEILERQARG